MYKMPENLRSLTNEESYEIKKHNGEWAIIDSRLSVIVFKGTAIECAKQVRSWGIEHFISPSLNYRISVRGSRHSG